MTKPKTKDDPLEYFRRAMAIQREGAQAAEDGRTGSACPYEDHPQTGAFDRTEWMTGYRQYQQERKTIRQGFIEYCSTSLDGHGWRVPLDVAVSSGRYVPRYYPLPTGMTAAEHERYDQDIHKDWAEYRVEGLAKALFSGMTQKSSDDFDR